MNEHDIERIFDTDRTEDDISEEAEYDTEIYDEDEADAAFRDLFAEEAPAPAREKRARRVHPLVWVGAGLAVLLIAAALWVNATFVIAGGFHRRDAVSLDLREKSISLKNYEKLSAQLPDCEILWSVPMGKDSFDCRSESLTLSRLSPEDYDLFAHFPALKSVDVTAVELTPADYRALAAAIPHCYIRWSIPIGGSRFDSAAPEITVSDFTAEEVELFGLFDGLTTVDAAACRCYDEILAVQALLPETKVLWTVELDGALLDQDTTAITLDGAANDYTAVNEYLRRLPALEQVTVDNCTLTAGEQTALREAYPHVAFTWPVELLGKTYDSSVTQLDFAGAGLTAAELQAIAEALPGFYALELLDLSGCGFTAEQVEPLYDIKPDLTIYWEFELYGQTFSTTATELELSNIPIDDLAPLEKAIARMPHLEKVIMCDCGLSNDVMDGLNKKYEDIRFVWMLHFKGFDVRTDTLGFIANGNEFSGNVTQQDVDEYLIYCEDIVSLDLGHKAITDLSFVQHMPKLKYLLLGATQVTDLTPLTQLDELIFLELQLTSTLTDLTPLVDCKSLLDLNIGYIATGHGQEYYDALSQMTWLERLWYSDHLMNDDLDQKLAQALPDSLIHISVMPDFICGAGWRTHDRYYEMRDLLGMYYMNEWGNEMAWRMVDGKYMLLRDYKAMIAAQEAEKAAQESAQTAEG